MRRFAFGFVLLGLPIFPSSVMAFDLDKNTVTTPDSTARLTDPDEAPLPAPLPSLHLQDDGASRPARCESPNSPWDEPSNHRGKWISDLAGSSDVAYKRGRRQPGRQQGLNTEPIKKRLLGVSLAVVDFSPVRF